MSKLSINKRRVMDHIPMNMQNKLFEVGQELRIVGYVRRDNVQFGPSDLVIIQTSSEVFKIKLIDLIRDFRTEDDSFIFAENGDEFVFPEIMTIVSHSPLVVNDEVVYPMCAYNNFQQLLESGQLSEDIIVDLPLLQLSGISPDKYQPMRQCIVK